MAKKRVYRVRRMYHVEELPFCDGPVMNFGPRFAVYYKDNGSDVCRCRSMGMARRVCALLNSRAATKKRASR